MQLSIPSIMLAPYPAAVAAWDQPPLERDFEYMNTVINQTRKLRADYGLTKQKPNLFIACSDARKAAMLGALTLEVATLSTSAEVTVLAAGDAPPGGCSVSVLDDVTAIYLLLKVRCAAKWRAAAYMALHSQNLAFLAACTCQCKISLC